ncbi:uncharacterized protein LOC115609249 isoform X2 [Strigops habroptila]|uniref:uncharacterized protein LOC115609249 isoform X2 n=1 Tax=Strigops habroptila TaxID=2489341 RepID=UPI0011CFA1FD|nr:uncharacterized protein LOC115609249 isoform X2 [Strigops habroptila]
MKSSAHGMPCPVGGAPQMCKQELEELMFPCVGCSKASSGLFRDIKSIPWHPSCHFSLSRDWLQVSTEQTWESCCHCRVHVHVQNVLEQGAGSSPAPVSASRSPLKSPFRAGAQVPGSARDRGSLAPCGAARINPPE